jgi:hemoglobin
MTLVTLATAAMLLRGPSAQGQTAKTLYQRLGGYDAIAAFVDTAFPRVARHPQLARLFQGHALDSQFRQRQLIIELLCRETGGPCVYIGRAMQTVHLGLGITEDEWRTFLTIITAALDDRKTSAPEKQELLDLFRERFKPDVVEKH